MTGTPQAGSPGWDRRRLLIGLAAVVLVAVVLVAGLVYAVYTTLTSTTTGNHATPPVAANPSMRGRMSSRDRIAAKPMLPVTPADARPTTPSALTPPVIVVPPPTGPGPADVPTGFPRTPEGAVGQLAAIDTTVLQAMSIPSTTEVYREWALPGGVGVAGWELTVDVQAFLGAARMGQIMDPTAAVLVAPAAGQVKGVDGPNWVVACVLLEVRATITAESRMGYGHCERMQWQATRWMIAPGTVPARAPSTWPGSRLSVRAGWRTWVNLGEG